jgi:hypothetical protein
LQPSPESGVEAAEPARQQWKFVAALTQGATAHDRGDSQLFFLHKE